MPEILDILESKNGIAIMLQLNAAPGEGMGFNQLLKKVGGSAGTLSVRIVQLESVGLVDEAQENKLGGRRLLSLTKKGKKAADHLKKATSA